MKIYYKILIISLINVLMLSLTGCSSMLSSKMPSGSVSMEQTYNDAINGDDNLDSGQNYSDMNALRTNVQPLSQLNPNDSFQTKVIKKRLEKEFSILPNPMIVMYVYPHLAGTGDDVVPVPGYETIFMLYAKTEYSL